MLLSFVWMMGMQSIIGSDGGSGGMVMARQWESLRPRFHFTARSGWINDPNGLVYYRGEYHLFFQHNPYSTQDGIKAWGHAVSPDLIHWQHLGDAIMPDEMGAIWSGSAVVDRENTSGLGSSKNPAIVAFYTAAGGTTPASSGKSFTQCIAFSTDRGRTWIKYPGNPVLAHIADQNRDPRVFWYGQGRKWIMALYLTGNTYGLFASQDLIHWTRLSTVTMPGSSECPDMFELPVVGEPGAARWIFVGGDGRYLIGRFDGNQFLPEAGPLQVDYGPNFYATQTWNDAPRSRRIQIAWMAGGRYPNMPFNQQLTLPFELTLRRTPDGLRMFREPIREFTRLRGHATKLPTTLIGPKRSLRISAPSDLVEMHVVLEIAECQRVVLQMGDVEISYSVKDGGLQAMGRSCPLRLENGRLSLHLIRDRTSLEVIAGNGAATFSGCIPPAPGPLHIEVMVEGGTGKLVSGTWWPIKPALDEAGAEIAH